MKQKSLLAVAVIGIAGLGFVAAAMWPTFRTPVRGTLADYTPNTPAARPNSPATQPVVRMSLPWDAARPAAQLSEARAGAPTPAWNQANARPQLKSAALPWSPQTGKESRSGDAPRPINLPSSSTLVADAAADLKFSPAVTAWLATWEQKTKANDPNASDGVTEFENLLAVEPATDTQLLSLMRATQSVEHRAGENRHSDPFGPISGAVACRAVYIGAEQARRDTKRRYTSMRNIAPPIERLWYGPDRDLRAVEAFYKILAEGEVEGSSDWIRGHVAQSEAMFKRGRAKEALAMLARLDNVSTPAMAQWAWKIEFDRGQYLIGALRFSEAIARFRHIIATEKNPVVRADSKALLVVACAKSGDLETALDEFAALRDAGQSSQYRIAAYAAIKAARQTHAEGPTQ